MSPAQIRKKINIEGRKIFSVDATSIAIKKLSRNIPNTPMLGALVKITGLIKLESLIEGFKEEYAGKFNNKLIEDNIAAMKDAFQEVRRE